MGQWFEKATLVDWIILIGMAVGVFFRGLEWYSKGRKLVDEQTNFVTRSQLEQELLKLDRDQKHWIRSQFTGYVPAEVHLELRHRIDRIENRVERLEVEERRHER
jgi:hypothetical protein